MDKVLEMAMMNKIKPYSSKLIRKYRTGFFLWGLTTVEVYGVYYEETLIFEGGKTSAERLVRFANAGYNLGLADGLRMDKLFWKFN